MGATSDGAAPPAADILEVAGLLAGRSMIALTGAGCSTESGIPDYRGPDARPNAPGPMQYRQFMGDAHARARYWARSAVGWPRIRDAQPNAAHRALARLEAAGLLRGIITQNVDGLHHAAGSRAVVELHGSLARVRCLGCGAGSRRSDFQARLLALNPGWPRLPEGAGPRRRHPGPHERQLAPDGDAHLPESVSAGFRVPACEACDGVLKPDVVFFGENVPKPRVADAWRLFEAAEVLLVAGSSLAVYSGRRFTDRARAEGRPVVIVNLGPTRADDAAAIKVEARLGRAMSGLADLLLGAPAPKPRPQS